jgi:hypothetical protein
LVKFDKFSYGFSIIRSSLLHQWAFLSQRVFKDVALNDTPYFTTAAAPPINASNAAIFYIGNLNRSFKKVYPPIIIISTQNNQNHFL